MRTCIVRMVCVSFLVILFQSLSFSASKEQALEQLTIPDYTQPQNLLASEAYQLRIIYMIPSNRSPQPGAEQKLQEFVLRMQEWYSEHMELLGYGAKTFLYEAEQNGLTPKVNIVTVSQPDTYFHGDRGSQWIRARSEIRNAGYPPGQPGELLFVVAEIHVQRANGSFQGHFVGGLGTSFSGMGMVTGDHLGRLSEALLTDNRVYNGFIIPEIGPYPLVQGVSFHGAEGSRLSSISSSAYGAAIHEVGHGFGLWHNFQNDDNFNGNLMGNGLRGFRGAIFPDLYPNDNTRLATASAILLNNSRFFNTNQTFTDDTGPQVEILSSGTVEPQDGLCQLEFTASDADSALGGAVLIRDSNVVADMTLTGNHVSTSISTHDYVPGVEHNWSLLVTDTQGNRRQSSTTSVACATGFNRAPQPYIDVSKSRIDVGEEVILDARRSSDPDGVFSRITVEWDLDGDGSFDTAPSTTKTRKNIYTQPGIYQIIARLTDEHGDSSLSMPMGIKVEYSLDSDLMIEKLINHSASPTPEQAIQLLVGTRYSANYKVTNNSPNRIYSVKVFEDGQLVCVLYALDPGESKQRHNCANSQDVLAGLNNVPANVTAKVSGSNQTLANQTGAYYTGFGNEPGKLKVTHYINEKTADTPGTAVTVNGNQAEVKFKVENTGSITLYRVKLYHDPASPVNSGWQELCFKGTLEPGEVRYCKRPISVTEGGLHKAFGRAQGRDTNVGSGAVINASNPTYFNVVLP